MDRVYRKGPACRAGVGHAPQPATVCDGGKISQLDHALQVATRAERAGADAELEPHIRPDVVKVIDRFPV